MSDVGIRLDDGVSSGGGDAAVADYFRLLKPRVMSLVIFTALAGIVLAPGGIHPWMALIALLCISLGAGASGALNMWYDADIDALMARTAVRPVPAGRVAPDEARTFGMVLGAGSVFMLGTLVNWTAAAFLAFTIFFYVAVYTVWLKRLTPQNIVIGGAAGAFPPMIGWSAVTGTIEPASLSLFLIIFLWTPPHFWALALFRASDYARAGVPMLPVVAGARSTRRQILGYSLALVPATLLPALIGIAGVAYACAALLLSGWLVHRAWRVCRERDEAAGKQAAKALFRCSILFLFAVFACLLVERLIGVVPLSALVA